MEMSSYDACLLITKNGSVNFGITGLQTDDTLNVGMEAFMRKEKSEIIEAKFKAKTQTILGTGASRGFNHYCIIIEAEFIMVIQKNQAEKLIFVDIKDNAKKQPYIEQHARGAYIVSIYQLEATFHYSIAAQSKKPSNKDIALLNKRIH